MTTVICKAPVSARSVAGTDLECPRCGLFSWWTRIDQHLFGRCPECSRRLLGSHFEHRRLYETYLIADDSYLCLRGC